MSQHPIISTLRTSRISLKMKIPNQNRPIVSARSRSTERISSCLDNTMTLPARVRYQTLNQRQRSHFHKRTSQTDRPPELLISFIFSSTKKKRRIKLLKCHYLNSFESTASTMTTLNLQSQGKVAVLQEMWRPRFQSSRDSEANHTKRITKESHSPSRTPPTQPRTQKHYP